MQHSHNPLDAERDILSKECNSCFYGLHYLDILHEDTGKFAS